MLQVAQADIAALQTKELWVPVSVFFNNPAFDFVSVTIGGHVAAMLGAVDDSAHIEFKCPADFNAITEAKVVARADVTQAAADIDISVAFASIGQACDTHTASDTATTYNITDTQLFGMSIATLLADMVAGDFVGIYVSLKNAAHDIDVIGFYLRYT